MRTRPDDRPNATARGYDNRWRKESKRFLRSRPWCECDDCRESGNPFRSEVVDHVTPHRGDPGLFWDIGNWRPMAKICHDRKTVKHDGGFGR